MTTPNNPTKYTGTDQYLIPFVSRSRQPTLADFRQPETGKNYPLGCIWQVGKNPSTGVEGQLWMLSKIVANQGYWVEIASTTGPILTLSDTAGTLVSPTAGGNIQLQGTANQVIVISDAGNNRLTFSLPGDPVIGPGASTDNALVRWDGTTGRLIQNGVITEDDTGNLSITASVVGASLSAIVANTSNTASATAFYNAQVAGGTASDAYYKTEINGGQAWTFGLDNSDSDAFALSSNVTLGTTNVMRAAITGEINYPLQPAFLSYLGTTDANTTGNGAMYTFGSGNALTEVFDQNSDMATNGVFTAPVTGRYSFSFALRISDITASTSGNVQFVTSNRTYTVASQNPVAVENSGAGWKPIGTSLTDMDAADTTTFTVQGDGEAGNVWSVIGVATNPTSFVSGYLTC